MKRLMHSLLTLGLAMLFLTPSYAQDADVDPLKASDVNADGIVNILDLVFVATYLGETPTEKQHPNPDVNGDGTVNILDLVLVAQHLGESIDPEDEVSDVESLYKELVGTYDLFKAEITYVDQPKLVLEPPKVVGTMTISSDRKITQKLQALGTSVFATGTLEILPDEGVMLIDNEAVDFISKSTYTWDGEILTTTLDTGLYIEKDFWRKLNNSVIDLQSPETVKAADNTAPSVISSTVKDGEVDVDPTAINEDRIEITFSEPVKPAIRKFIALQTEEGDDVGWLGRVDGNKATLEPVAGKELSSNTTYVIKGRFSDAAGNETEISITFTTLQFFIAEENLVSYWPFDETFDETIDGLPLVPDVFGWHVGEWHDGELFGGLWVDGIFGKALEFDGVDDRVVVGNYPTSDITENMTFMAWCYPTDILTDRAFIVKHGSFYVGFGEQDQLKFVVQPHDISVESTNNSLSLREWYHLAVTFDGKTMRVYIDGELNNELPNDIPITPSETELVIGQGFSGIIDEVLLYNKALSQDEIEIIFMQGVFSSN